ncbi:condensation domain-containing protein, partial [Pyxidicoccus caerfyrddinensis]|uniref:condensation domain-containing protein n=1 Tax=Pyxidicoccus caerfyrddinensis TaxID=2709663 RepID=UPI0013DC84F7
GSATLNVSVSVRLSGQLDDAALRAALNELVRRHETLRTTFVEQDGRPFQQIASTLELPLDVVALREEQVQERLHAEARRPFDLENGPLLHAVLFRLAAEEHVLLLSLHHIITDGWSMGVLVREVSELYAAFVAGR